MTVESTRPQVHKFKESTDHSPQTNGLAAESTATSHQPPVVVRSIGFCSRACHPRSRELARRLVVLMVMVVLLSANGVQAAHFNYRVITPEMVGEDVYYLQSFLRQLGLYKGEITEHYDYNTQDAVKLFQQRYHLPDTGWVDGNTANALLSAVNQEVNLVVDGQYQLLSPPPMLADGHFYFPIDAAVEILGIGSKITDNGVDLLFRSEVWPVSVAGQRGSTSLEAAGRATARQCQGTLYLPLRSLAGWVGASVAWDAVTQTASVELPADHRPYQASGTHYLRRAATIAYPDRVRLILYLSSITAEPYTPRMLTYDPLSGNWLGQLDGISMGAESRELPLNDPTIRLVKLTQVKGALTLTITPSDGQQISDCEWLLDPEHDRLILDMYRAQ